MHLVISHDPCSPLLIIFGFVYLRQGPTGILIFVDDEVAIVNSYEQSNSLELALTQLISDHLSLSQY